MLSYNTCVVHASLRLYYGWWKKLVTRVQKSILKELSAQSPVVVVVIFIMIIGTNHFIPRSICWQLKEQSQCTKYYIVWVLFAKVMEAQSFTSGCHNNRYQRQMYCHSSPYNNFRTKPSSHLDDWFETTKVPWVIKSLVGTWSEVDVEKI